MAIWDFTGISKIFGGGEPTPEERQGLFKEAMLMALARATSSDAHIHPVEVETVHKVLLQETGEKVDAAQIRVAAGSALFESTPLEKYLAKAAVKLDTSERIRIVEALATVIKSDVRISSSEVAFFNKVATAMKITPAELAGLIAV